MTKFLLVDVKDIQSDVPRSNFSESTLEQLADSILASNGVVRPLVLKPTGVDSYTILEGHLEYYAAVRAKEKNPKQGELVNAFVVSPKLELRVSEQIQLLKGTDPDPSPKPAVDDSRLTNLELRFEKYINQLREEKAEEKRAIEARLKVVESKIVEESDPLELINTLDVHELTVKLTRSRIPKAEKLAQTICDLRQEQPKQQFNSYSDVVKLVKGLKIKGLFGDKTMLTIIDDWSRG
jgi:hypothetical protein